MREAWLDQLEALLAEADEATAVVTVASVAGRELELDAEELRGAGRRALLVLAAGSRLSQYVGATVGEIGFLRGIWLDGARRLAWLEDYARALDENADQRVPDRLEDGIRLDHVSFRYPGTDRVVLDDVSPSTLALAVDYGAGRRAGEGDAPALIVAHALYGYTRARANLPMLLTPTIAVGVLVLSALMCSIAALLTVRKVASSDPASLF